MVAVYDSWGKLPSNIDLLYADIPFGTGEVQETATNSYQDIKKSDVQNFVSSMLEGVELSADANVLIHCDWRAKWDVKSFLDSTDLIFNCEIVWCYRSGGASKSTLPNKFDTIFWYSKSSDRVYNLEREPYSHDYSSSKNFHKFHPDGKMVCDWWDISIISSTGLERVGYPNQKPLKLMDRVVNMFSDSDSVLVDPCCGSGSFLVSALNNGRSNCFGVDVSEEARRITEKRLAEFYEQR